MKFNLKNRPKTADMNLVVIPSAVEEWFEGFFLQTIPRLLKRLESYKDSIPVDVAMQIVREELLGDA